MSPSGAHPVERGAKSGCTTARCIRVAQIGAVAQPGERRVRNAKVRGSIPLGSTNHIFNLLIYKEVFFHSLMRLPF